MPERILVQNLSSSPHPAEEIRRLLHVSSDTHIDIFERRYLRRLLLSPMKLWETLRASPPARHILLLDRIYPRAHPLRTTLTALLQNAGSRQMLDRQGCVETIQWRDALFRDFLGRACQPLERRRLIRWAETELRALLASPARKLPRFDPKNRPILYTLCDPLLGYVAGGIGAHASGLIGGLRGNGMDVAFVAVDRFAPVESLGIDTHIAPWNSFAEAAENTIGANRAIIRKCTQLMTQKEFSCIYQRSGLHAFGGALMARQASLPLVLEYNGSEAWVAKHWGNGTPPLPELSKLASRATEHAADLIVVVSEPLRRELLDRGVSDDKILVQPNAADTQRFRSGIDARQLRTQLFGPAVPEPKAVPEPDTDPIIVGFFGTFGKWHGTEVLAKAAAIATLTNPRLHWLFVGDGLMAAETKRIIAAAGLARQARFTGMIAHTEAPAYLAACDILVSPTLPNADGSPFFGSPTKLFEYMATGRAIVASRIGQLAQVIEDGRTGVLVEPGDPNALAATLNSLASDPQRRQRLGQQARAQCEEKHTWIQAASNILQALRKRCP